MAAASPAPKPLIYCNSDVSGRVQDHIVSVCAHPSRDLVGVGDIVGKITLYEISVFTSVDHYLHMLCMLGIHTKQMSSVAEWHLSHLSMDTPAEC